MPAEPEPTLCPYCQTPSWHPLDRAKGWCARCSRFYPEGEGPDPGDSRQFQRFNRRRHELIDQMFNHPDYSFSRFLEGDEKEAALLTPDEQAEYARLNRQVDEWIDGMYPLPPLPDWAEIERRIAVETAAILARLRQKKER